MQNPPQANQKSKVSKYYNKIGVNREKILEAIEDIQNDQHYVPRENREKRASGAALQVAINTITSLGINTRFVSIISGPCTVGPGKVV